jgi:hypothetical protein
MSEEDSLNNNDDNSSNSNNNNNNTQQRVHLLERRHHQNDDEDNDSSFEEQQQQRCQIHLRLSNIFRREDTNSTLISTESDEEEDNESIVLNGTNRVEDSIHEHHVVGEEGNEDTYDLDNNVSGIVGSSGDQVSNTMNNVNSNDNIDENNNILTITSMLNDTDHNQHNDSNDVININISRSGNRNNNSSINNSDNESRRSRALDRIIPKMKDNHPYFLTLDFFSRYNIHNTCLLIQTLLACIHMLLTQLWKSTLFYIPLWLLHYTTLFLPLYIMSMIHCIKIGVWIVQQLYKFEKRRRRGRSMSERRRKRKRTQVYTVLCSFLFHIALLVTLLLVSLKLQKVDNFSHSAVTLNWNWFFICFPMILYLSIQLIFTFLFHVIFIRNVFQFAASLALLVSTLLFIIFLDLYLEKSALFKYITAVTFIYLAFPLFINLLILLVLFMKSLVSSFQAGIMAPATNITSNSERNAAEIKMQERLSFRMDTISKIFYVFMWMSILLTCVIIFVKKGVTPLHPIDHEILIPSSDMTEGSTIMQSNTWAQNRYIFIILSLLLIPFSFATLWSNTRLWIVHKLYKHIYAPRITAATFSNAYNSRSQLNTIDRESEERRMLEMENISPFALFYLHSLMQHAANRQRLDAATATTATANSSNNRAHDLDMTNNSNTNQPFFSSTINDGTNDFNAEQFFSLIRRMQHRRGIGNLSSANSGLSRRYINMLPTFHYVTPASKFESQSENDSQSSGIHNCSICLEEFQNGELLRMLPCFHRFHVTCIDDWLSEKGTCPICRNIAIQSVINSTFDESNQNINSSRTSDVFYHSI